MEYRKIFVLAVRVLPKNFSSIMLIDSDMNEYFGVTKGVLRGNILTLFELLSIRL